MRRTFGGAAQPTKAASTRYEAEGGLNHQTLRIQAMIGGKVAQDVHGLRHAIARETEEAAAQLAAQTRCTPIVDWIRRPHGSGCTPDT